MSGNRSRRQRSHAGIAVVGDIVDVPVPAIAQELLQEQVVEQSRMALQLAEVRYREGVYDLLTVLDAQRTLFQAEDQLAQIRLSRLQASIGLFYALGCGWTMTEPPREPAQG